MVYMKRQENGNFVCVDVGGRRLAIASGKVDFTGYPMLDVYFGGSGTPEGLSCRKVVLPAAMSGIVTSIILSIGRIVGESAALIYTAGAVPYTPSGYLDQGSSFAVMMWMFAGEGMYVDSAYATACILMIFVALLNLLVTLCERKFRKKQGIAK